MMQGQNPNQLQDQDQFKPKHALNILYRLAESMGMGVTVFSRHSFGTEYPGISGLIGLLIILFIGADSRDPVMFNFFWLVLGALIVQRLRTWQLVRKGAHLHSRFSGIPWLTKKLFRIQREDAARNLEIPLCVVVGGLLCPLSITLGSYIIACSFALFITRATDLQINTMRVRRMRDAALEQQYVADLYRGKRDDY